MKNKKEMKKIINSKIKNNFKLRIIEIRKMKYKNNKRIQ